MDKDNCEMCDYEYDHPSRLSLLLEWRKYAESDNSTIPALSLWERESELIEELMSGSLIAVDLIRERGIKQGWWKK